MQPSRFGVLTVLLLIACGSGSDPRMRADGQLSKDFSTVDSRACIKRLCVYTPGYWKTHGIAGPAVPFDDWWQNFAEGLTEDSPFYLSEQSWIQVINTPPAGNAYYQMAFQYIAAYLNRASIPYWTDPALNSPTLNHAFEVAEDLLGTYRPAEIALLKGSNPVRAQFIWAAGVFGQFNQGNLTVPHCGE